MDIRVVSSGRVFYRVDPTLAALLLELMPAAVERVNEPTAERVNQPTAPVAAPVPQCGIGMTVSGFAFVKWTLGARNEIYDGPPAGLVAFFAKMNITLPAETVERYASVWEPRPLKLD